ncbi:MAG: tetratricopeptide repeat protein, partial [Acidimicrobiales bacterium]
AAAGRRPAPAKATGSRSGRDAGPRPPRARGQVVRKGWGSVARRGASAVRADDGTRRTPGADTPEGRRRTRTRDDDFVPERWERTDRGSKGRTPRSETPKAAPALSPAPVSRRKDRPAEGLPADVLAELASAAGPDWGMLRERVTERMAAGLGAYERERYRDASRILKTVVDAVPDAASARELLGLSHYRQSNWRAASGNLEAYGALTGSVDLHPVRMDCQRAIGRPRRVEALFSELRQGSPDPEVLSEGRLVLAGTRADMGDLAGAVALLLEAGAGRRVRNPSERHLRQWYVLADLAERSGDLARSRELFLRISDADPHSYDVDDRLESLGPPVRRRRAANRPRAAR